MSRITPQELSRRRQEFQEEAGRAFDQMLGSDGQNGLVTFAEREQRACEVGDALTRLLLEEHLDADEFNDPGAQVDCPLCGGPVACDHPEKVALESRRVLTKRGRVAYERAARRCPRCRRIFFPHG